MTATDAIVLLPVALGSLTVGLLFLPLAWRGGYRRGWQESADEMRRELYLAALGGAR